MILLAAQGIWWYQAPSVVSVVAWSMRKRAVYKGGMAGCLTVACMVLLMLVSLRIVDAVAPRASFVGIAFPVPQQRNRIDTHACSRAECARLAELTASSDGPKSGPSRASGPGRSGASWQTLARADRPSNVLAI